MIRPATLGIWLLLFFPNLTSSACFLGKAAVCQDAEFAPGSDLAGEGFDITKMQRLGAFVIDMSKWELENNTCNLCKNPFMQGKKQKLPKSVIDWRPSQKCRMSLSSSVYESSESLVSSSVSSVENNWKAGLEIGNILSKASVTFAGTNSRLADYSLAKTKKDKFSFIKQSVSCAYYRYRISSKSSVHPELSYEFTNLPAIYNNQTKESYWSFVERFGTHYITKVKLGGAAQSVTSVKECMASLQHLSTEEVKTCLDVEASVSVRGRVGVNTAYHHCKQARDKKLNKDSFAHTFSDRLSEITGGHTEDPALLFSSSNDPGAYKQWLSSVPGKPDVISFSLKPLHVLLPVKNPMQSHLRRAIRDYILQRALWRNCSTPCRVGIARNPKEPCECSCHNNPAVKANCCPVQLGYAQITVVAVKATGLWGDYSSSTDGYVKVLRNHKILLGTTAVIWHQNSPTWNWAFNLGNNVLSKIGVLRLEVWDRDSGWDDDLLGACNIQLKAGNTSNFCRLNHGVLYYNTQVTCAPGLTGSSCSEYTGFPMSTALENIYVSRHARPLPKDVLLKMGVLLDERRVLFGQSGDLKSEAMIFKGREEKHKMSENFL
ncbi:perforin 1.9 [Triplophysa rosa]|uniref:Perforin-like protein 1 n=1 Tax=Triplophysa rosa TaxID=992332 RepID=A0A9W7TTP0_TRIRA|nr:perforin 1.9 [Triplophysa rosa]KAI7803307.1 perforin-like protein 1 [Triplophysa rosa]